MQLYAFALLVLLAGEAESVVTPSGDHKQDSSPPIYDLLVESSDKEVLDAEDESSDTGIIPAPVPRGNSLAPPLNPSGTGPGMRREIGNLPRAADTTTGATDSTTGSPSMRRETGSPPIRWGGNAATDAGGSPTDAGRATTDGGEFTTDGGGNLGTLPLYEELALQLTPQVIAALRNASTTRILGVIVDFVQLGAILWAVFLLHKALGARSR